MGLTPVIRVALWQGCNSNNPHTWTPMTLTQKDHCISKIVKFGFENQHGHTRTTTRERQLLRQLCKPELQLRTYKSCNISSEACCDFRNFHGLQTQSVWQAPIHELPISPSADNMAWQSGLGSRYCSCSRWQFTGRSCSCAAWGKYRWSAWSIL